MPDSLREAGDLFAREATVTAAEEIHQRARGQKRGEDWRTALGLYERLLVKWPNDPRAIAWLVSGGEAASRLDRFDDAASYFHRAAAGEGELAREAAFQELAAMDAAVNAETQPSIRARRARAFVASSSAYRARRGDDPRGKDLLWREGELGLAADADSMALRALTEFAHRYPDDARGSGALARVAERSEASGDVPRAAAAWGELARLWPERSDADVALYKSAAAYARIDSIPAALVAYRRLLRAYPTRELSRDAALEVGRLEETRGDSSAAAEAFADFAARYPKDTEAGAALLHAIALWDGAHAETQADATRLAYLDRYPEDLDAQFEFRERFARRELDERRSAGTLALVARPAAPARSSRGVKKRAKDAASDSTPLAAYLALAVRHPEHANADFLAEVDFARGEEARADYDAARLSLPLDRSLAVKRAALERCLAEYRATLDHHVARWSEAATYRMGEAVVAFGDALVASPRPDDLSAEDRAGYDGVVEEQAWGFYDRGEEIWGELLEANAASADSTTSSEWVEKTRHALWPRVAARFLHYPEAVHPVLLPDEGSHD